VRVVALALCASLVVTSTGCFAPSIADPRTRCAVAQAAAVEVKRGTLRPRELVELSAGSPRAQAYAARAYHLGNTVLAVTILGGVALATGLIMGFAADPTLPEVRNAGYGLVGSALGLGVLSIGFGYGARKDRAKSIATLLQYAQTCSTSVE
jgi:hypothetical protein